jgi:hypothetical protein
MQSKKLKKDLHNRQFFLSKELKINIIRKILFKYFFHYDNLKHFILKKIKINFFITRLKNYCILTGHCKKISIFFKISKFQIKKLSNLGFIFGLRKSN